MGLDKFYTQREVVKKCFEFLKDNINIENTSIFLEPSAGAGVFLEFFATLCCFRYCPRMGSY